MSTSQCLSLFFFFNDPAPTEIYPLPLPAALPISAPEAVAAQLRDAALAGHNTPYQWVSELTSHFGPRPAGSVKERSEEHTSELQSQSNLVCRLLLEKKKKYDNIR